MEGALYKAKRSDNGEWVEGYLLVANNVYSIIPLNNCIFELENSCLNIPKWYEVDPSTVCRHTGKQYMNWEDAWENDIFESQLNGLRMVLKYGTYQAYCPADKAFMETVGFYAAAEGYPDMPIGDLRSYAIKVGNLFDGLKSLQSLRM